VNISASIFFQALIVAQISNSLFCSEDLNETVSVVDTVVKEAQVWSESSDISLLAKGVPYFVSRQTVTNMCLEGCLLVYMLYWVTPTPSPHLRRCQLLTGTSATICRPCRV